MLLIADTAQLELMGKLCILQENLLLYLDFHIKKQEAQLLLGDRATRKHAKDSSLGVTPFEYWDERDIPRN